MVERWRSVLFITGVEDHDGDDDDDCDDDCDDDDAGYDDGDDDEVVYIYSDWS